MNRCVVYYPRLFSEEEGHILREVLEHYQHRKGRNYELASASRLIPTTI